MINKLNEQNMHFEDADLNAVNKEISFLLRTEPGSRIRMCNAKLMRHTNSSAFYLTAELPILVNRSEFTGVGAALAALNELMPEDVPFELTRGAMHMRDGFLLDVIDGVIRYEARAWRDDGVENLRQLSRFAVDAAAKSIGKWSEEILRMVSNESIRLEQEERNRIREEIAARMRSRKKTFRDYVSDFFDFIVNGPFSDAGDEPDAFDDDEDFAPDDDDVCIAPTVPHRVRVIPFCAEPEECFADEEENKREGENEDAPKGD